MLPSIGRIVQYTLTEQDASAIYIGRSNRHGNTAEAGDIYPAMIVRVWADTPTETTAVNLQVFVDGNDTYWATSRHQGEGPGCWVSPADQPAPAPAQDQTPAVSYEQTPAE